MLFRRFVARMSTLGNEANFIINTKNGLIKGKANKSFDKGMSFYEFKGIPYARPPVGDLRFAEPQPPLSWTGIRDAETDRNICFQWDMSNKKFVGDEDCLYLNVYTPTMNTNSLLPVMVYFHGGGFQYGSGADSSVHVPDFLVEKNVIFVGLNYRLGILGFLSLDCKEATGNMGLKDQVLALKWVKENIEKFGGDPNNVTVVGVSAGAAALQYLITSKFAKGLFHKAIFQSGSSLNHWAFSDSIKSLAYKIAQLNDKTIDNNKDLLEYLKQLSKEDLIKSSMAVVTSSGKGALHFGFVPTIEKPINDEWEAIIDKHPYDFLFNSENINIPIITGICSQEALLLLRNERIMNEKLDEKIMVDKLPFDINSEFKSELQDKIKNAYFDKKDSLSLSIDYYSDTEIVSGVFASAKIFAKCSKVYFYEFAYDGKLNHLKSKLNITHPGACHSDENGYLIKRAMLTNDIPTSDIIVRRRMMDLWTNFAKVSNPTPQIDDVINVKWVPFSEPNYNYFIIDKELKLSTDQYNPNRMDLFLNLYLSSKI